MEDKDLIERLVKNEESLKSAIRRLNGIEQKIENIQELTIAVKEIAMETKATREDVNDMNNRLKTVEEKPARNWENLIKTFLTCLATAILGFMLAKFGL